MDLPDRAQPMYSTWWALAMQAASSTSEATGKPYSVADFTTTAAEIRRMPGNESLPYDAPGLSQLFSIAKTIANGAVALNAADPSSPITPDMYGEAPWSRPAGEQLAQQEWLARVEVSYTDEAGVPQSGIFSVSIPQVLPSSVGSLQAQMQLRISDMLATPPGTGTPRSGTLSAIGPITLLQV